MRKICENFGFGLGVVWKYLGKVPSSFTSGKKSLDGMYSKSGIGEIKFGEKEMLKIIDKNNDEIMNILKIW